MPRKNAKQQSTKNERDKYERVLAYNDEVRGVPEHRKYIRRLASAILCYRKFDAAVNLGKRDLRRNSRESKRRL